MPLARQVHQPLAALDAKQHEAINQRALDIPGQPLVILGRNQRKPRPIGVAGLRNALHKRPCPWIVEEIGQRLDGGHANGVDLASSQQAPLEVRPAIAHLPRHGLDMLPDLFAHHFGTAEDIGRGPCETPAALATSANLTPLLVTKLLVGHRFAEAILSHFWIGSNLP